jgi:hypothetical protein
LVLTVGFDMPPTRALRAPMEPLQRAQGGRLCHHESSPRARLARADAFLDPAGHLGPRPQAAVRRRSLQRLIQLCLLLAAEQPWPAPIGMAPVPDAVLSVGGVASGDRADPLQ